MAVPNQTWTPPGVAGNNPAMSTRANSAFKVIAFNGLMLVIGFIVLEALFGNWFRPNRMNRLNLVRDTTRKFDASGLYDTGGEVGAYTRDEWGLRGAYPALDRIDILTVGGSTTDQRYTTDGETWQDVMVQRFGKDGIEVSVVNGGVDGQSSYGHIKNFAWWYPALEGLRVRYFLFYVGNNDFLKDENYEFDDLVDDSSGFKAKIKDNSVLYHVYNTLRGWHRAREVVNLDHHYVDYSKFEWTGKPLLNNHREVMRRRLEAYRKRLLMLTAHVKETGAVPILVTQYNRNYKWTGDGTVVGNAKEEKYDDVIINGVDRYYMLSMINDVTLSVANEVGGISLDLAREIKWEDDDFYDTVHTTPKGARKIGLYLHDKLAHVFADRSP